MLIDDRYSPEVEWKVGTKPLWNIHNVMPAPYEFEGGAMLVGSLEMVKGADVDSL